MTSIAARPLLARAALAALLAMAAVLVTTSCPAPEPPPGPTLPLVDDAGDDAFVRGAALLMWGRRPLSGSETDVLSAITASTSRADLVRAMAGSPEYVERWSAFLLDSLVVNRVGYRAEPWCYGLRARDELDGSLAQALAASTDWSQPLVGGPWTMADGVRDSLIADHLGPLYRAQILAGLPQHLRPLTLDEDLAIRQDLASVFEASYLGRDLDCLPCHNTEFSVTGHQDPVLDRTWELPGLVERALFGDSSGRPRAELSFLFRMRGVSSGYKLDNEPAEPFTLAVGDGCRVEPTFAGCAGCPCEAVVCEQDPSCCLSAWSGACVSLCVDSGMGCESDWPTDFSGCQPVFGADGEGCGGCACQSDVCETRPSCCEGTWDLECAQLCQQSGGCSVEEVAPEAVMPWGMHPACGGLVPEDRVLLDLTSGSGYLGGDLGPAASASDIEALLAQGLDGLATQGFQPAGDGGVEPDVALAHMLAVNLANGVWAEAFGSPLTLGHGFSRNEAQQRRLGALVDVLVATDFSLVELLASVATDPLFNAPVPMVAEAGSPYWMPALFDPFSADWEDPLLTGNGLGERLHRLDARVMERAAARALGWFELKGFYGQSAHPDAVFEAGIGVPISDAAPGFEGVGFQSLLTWEERAARCESVVATSSAPGCTPTGGPGCGVGEEDCACRLKDLCGAFPSCCDDVWDAKCAAACEVAGSCPPDQPTIEPDWVDDLAALAPTARDGISALKERIVGDARLDAEEESLFTQLTGRPMDGPIDARGLRAACGALLLSPDFLLVGLPQDAPTDRPGAVLPGDDFEGHCQRLSTELFGGELRCEQPGLGL